MSVLYLLAVLKAYSQVIAVAAKGPETRVSTGMSFSWTMKVLIQRFLETMICSTMVEDRNNRIFRVGLVFIPLGKAYD